MNGKKDTVVCLAGAQSLLRPEKKIQSSVWWVRDHYYDRKKKIQSSVWWVRDHYYDRKKKRQSSVCWVRGSGDYDRKKKDTVVCLAGCAVVSVFGSGGKLAVFLLWRESFITTKKKQSSSRLSGGCVIIITTGKIKRYSRLSGGCAIMSVFLVAIVIFVLVQLELYLIQIC